MDFQFWLYLAIVILSLLAQIRKKRAQQAEQDLPPPGQGRTEEPKPISFEDLLREIQQSKMPVPASPLPPQRPYNQDDEVEDFDEDLPAEERNLEQPKTAFSDSYAIYEKAKADAFARPSLEETMKVEDTEVRFGQFDKYQHVRETAPAASFAETFRNFAEFKRAFVMAEILKPKF